MSTGVISSQDYRFLPENFLRILFRYDNMLGLIPGFQQRLGTLPSFDMLCKCPDSVSVSLMNEVSVCMSQTGVSLILV